MRRASAERTKREMSLGKKILLVAIFGILALVGVFSVLALTHERINYDEARENVAEIAKTKEPIEKFFDAKIDKLEMNDGVKVQIAEFEGAIEKSKNYITSLEASNVLKDEAVKEKFKAVKEKYAAIEKLSKTWEEVKLLFDLTDENLATLKKSENEYLKTLAEELSEYRLEVANFKKQYEASTTKDSGVIESYGKMQLIGEGLNKKYEKATLEDVLGMSRDDISGFYATIEELNKVLTAR